MRRLIDKYDFMDALRNLLEGKPMFGTCAGLILLAKKLVGYNEPHIGVMDITVERIPLVASVKALKQTSRLKMLLKASLRCLFVRRTLLRQERMLKFLLSIMTALLPHGKVNFLAAPSIRN